MKKTIKTIVLLVGVLMSTISISAQSGTIPIRTFLELSQSSLASINQRLQDYGYSLQHTKENCINDKHKDVIWGYRAEFQYGYGNCNEAYRTPSSGYFSSILIVFSEDNEVVNIVYHFNNQNTYRTYLNELTNYGYAKSENIDLELNSIHLSYYNAQENKGIGLFQNAQDNPFPYTLVW